VNEQKPFDARLAEIFKVGDLVSWCDNLMKEKEYGFIQKIYIHEIDHGNNISTREFMFAKIKKSDGGTENFMLSALTLESQNK
jgi:hypothetical protein